jgi:cell wall assembly regulator SMI1
MIPSTYAIVRNRFYNVGLIPDFVDGMRNHLNPVKAMLLYMKMVWEDLLMNDVVYQALQSGIATQKELIAAGYNSNPARLPLYIQRGGANWRELIPAETKIYLEIYRSMELFVPLEPRKE